MKYTYAEYFLGIGAPGKAIDRVTKRHGDECEFVYGFEIDKYARNAFCAIHNVDEAKIFHDITDQPDILPYVDIIFYSPPCQTFSIAGKKEGTSADKGNLFYSALEGIKKSNPKYAIMENVANLKNQFKDDFRAMILALEDAGYVNYSRVLNSKDYGIPQNRERIFIVSIRKDIYEQGIRFEWPKPIKLEKRLKDVLQTNVAEKYYLSEEMVDYFIKNTEKQSGNGFKFQPQDGKGIAKAITTRAGARMDDNFIKVNSATKKGYEIAVEGDSINLDQPTSKTRRGRVGKGVAQTLTTSCNQAVVDFPCIAASRGRDKNNPTDRTAGNQNLQQRLEINANGTSNALTSVQKDNYVVEASFRIRKLTPLECFRLQGFDDEDYYKAVQAYETKWEKGASDSQMYKRAGNSITVQVEEGMIEILLYQTKQLGVQIAMY